MAGEFERLCLDALREVAKTGKSEYVKGLVEGMRSFKAHFRRGMCYGALVVERDTGTNLVLIKFAVNGFIKKVMEIPIEVADEYLKVAVEALKEYIEKKEGREG